jgi:hypothetical protein
MEQIIDFQVVAQIACSTYHFTYFSEFPVIVAQVIYPTEHFTKGSSFN